MRTLNFFSIIMLIGCAQADVIVSVPVSDWGKWGEFELCNPGLVAQGFELKTQPPLGSYWEKDDTALNAISLFCGDPKNLEAVTSMIGQYGKWGKVFSCFPGVITGFQLRVEPFQGHGLKDADDTGTNNVRFWCDKKNGYPAEPIEGDGGKLGNWGEIHHCPKSMAICGIQTQIEYWETYLHDSTQLNNIRFECCFFV